MKASAGKEDTNSRNVDTDDESSEPVKTTESRQEPERTGRKFCC